MIAYSHDTQRITNVNTTCIIAPRISCCMENEPHERLRLAYERAGYPSAAKTARAFGWNESTFRSHANGSRPFYHDDAIKYAKVLKVNPIWLLCMERYQADNYTPPPEVLNESTVAQIVASFARIEREGPLPEAVLQSIGEIVRQIVEALEQSPTIHGKSDAIETVVRTAIAPYRAKRH